MTENNKGDVNWSRFGLDPVGQSSPPRSHQDHSGSEASGSTARGNPNVKDLFDEDQVRNKRFEFINNAERVDFMVTFDFSSNHHLVDFIQRFPQLILIIFMKNE